MACPRRVRSVPWPSRAPKATDGHRMVHYFYYRFKEGLTSGFFCEIIVPVASPAPFARR
jgi:hypothetical protein